MSKALFKSLAKVIKEKGKPTTVAVLVTMLDKHYKMREHKGYIIKGSKFAAVHYVGAEVEVYTLTADGEGLRPYFGNDIDAIREDLIGPDPAVVAAREALAAIKVPQGFSIVLGRDGTPDLVRGGASAVAAPKRGVPPVLQLAKGTKVYQRHDGSSWTVTATDPVEGTTIKRDLEEGEVAQRPSVRRNRIVVIKSLSRHWTLEKPAAVAT